LGCIEVEQVEVHAGKLEKSDRVVGRLGQSVIQECLRVLGIPLHPHLEGLNCDRGLLGCQGIRAEEDQPCD